MQPQAHTTDPDSRRERDPGGPAGRVWAFACVRTGIEAALTRSIPDDFIERPLDEQRIITSICLVLHSGIVVLVAFFLYYATIDLRQAMLCLPPAALFALGLVVLRRGNTVLTMHAGLFTMVLMLDFFTLLTGGPDSTTPMWYAVVPIMAMSLLPKRVGIAWAIAMVVHQFALLGVYELGWYSWALAPAEDRRFGDFIIAFVAAPIVSGVFAFWTARARDELAARLGNARDILQMVLDEVPTSFLIVDRECRLTQPPSMGEISVSREARTGDSLVDLLCSAHLERGARFAVGFDALVEEVLPVELLLEQMPQHWTFNGRDLSVRYHLVYDLVGHPWTRLALTVNDVTEARRRERFEKQRDTFARIVHLLQTERDAFLDFVHESDRLIDVLQAGTGQDGWLRALHTLKGTSGVFGLSALSDACHEAEQIALAGSRQRAQQLVDSAWTQWRDAFRELTEHGGFDGIRVERQTLSTFEAAVLNDVPYEELLQTVHQWTYLPIRRALERVAGRAAAVAERLGRPIPIVVVECGDLRVDADRWRPLWASMIHLVRNAVDHGFDQGRDRRGGAEGRAGTLTMRASMRGETLLIEISDDGNGIDWDAVRAKAQELGLPVDQDTSVEWLLAEGLSTRRTVDEISGRGVGLAAVAEAVRELGGELDVVSKLGQGTTWRLSFPAKNMHAATAPHSRRSAAMLAIAS